MTHKRHAGIQQYWIALIVILVLVATIPVIIYLTQRSQDIRPLALNGKANMLLSASEPSVDTNGTFTVLITAQMTDSSVRVSGADVTVKYDKKLKVESIEPATTDNQANAAFTDAPVVTEEMPVNASTNALRIAVISNKTNSDLSGGTVKIGTVTFRALTEGEALIEFDTSKLEIVGIQL